MISKMIQGLLGLLLASSMVHAQASTTADTRVYEMRIYYAPEGKLDDLHARFRDHTVKLFEKHGITSLGYWVPLDNKENKLVYLLSYPSREAAKVSWNKFMADPEWQKAWKESEKNGPLVKKAESIYMKPVDYCDPIKAENVGNRIFELREYTTPDGKLNDLHARFRNHTVKLFAKHGMTNLGYWEPLGKPNTLIYVLAHSSPEAHKESFGKFREDPSWKQAKSASEANGSLTVENGVKSTLMKATDYSRIQ